MLKFTELLTDLSQNVVSVQAMFEFDTEVLLLKFNHTLFISIPFH